MEASLTDDDILSNLKHYRRNILLLLYRHGETRTRDLREQTNIPRGSKEHHLGKLTDWGLIEVVGKSDRGGGIPERVFGLTDRGTEFVGDNLAGEDDRPDGWELRLERLEDTIAELEGQIEQQQTTITRQANEIEDLEQVMGKQASEIEVLRRALAEHEQTFGEFVDTVQNEFYEEIIDEIEARA